MSPLHIFLSPHLDDAVFSCGGAIAALTKAGERVVVVTVTAASPDLRRLPESARSLHSLWGIAGDAVAARRKEDFAAAALLGFEPVHLDFLDAIYRTDSHGRFLYPTRESLFPDGRWQRERTLALRLSMRLSGLGSEQMACAADSGPARKETDGAADSGPARKETEGAADSGPARKGSAGAATFYAPLALGRHVDHQLLRRAVRLAGLNPAWYEDFPYVGSESALESGDVRTAACRVAQLVGCRSTGLRQVLVPFDPDLRAQAMRAYRSQLGAVFGSEEEMLEEMTAFLPRGTDGSPAERLWFPEDCPLPTWFTRAG